jgi:transcriptional regulator with XRE-family HTH domain
MLLHMPNIPICHPDGPRIRQLIRARGYTQAGFARKIGRPTASASMWNICSGATKRVSLDLIRQIATGLRVRPGDISDWTGDDEGWEGPVTRVPATIPA